MYKAMTYKGLEDLKLFDIILGHSSSEGKISEKKKSK